MCLVFNGMITARFILLFLFLECFVACHDEVVIWSNAFPVWVLALNVFQLNLIRIEIFEDIVSVFRHWNFWLYNKHTHQKAAHEIVLSLLIFSLFCIYGGLGGGWDSEGRGFGPLFQEVWATPAFPVYNMFFCSWFTVGLQLLCTGSVGIMPAHF